MRKSLLIPLFVLLLLAAVSLALDFKAARSDTTASSQFSTIRSGEEYSERPPLAVYVLALENLAKPLRRQLVERLAARAPFSTVTSTETPASTTETAALVVVVERRTHIWTPLYASADLEVQVAFASDGQVDWNEPGEIDTVMQASPAVRLSGEPGIQDRTLGQVSQPACRNHITSQVSDRVVETVNQAFTNVNL